MERHADEVKEGQKMVKEKKQVHEKYMTDRQDSVKSEKNTGILGDKIRDKGCH